MFPHIIDLSTVDDGYGEYWSILHIYSSLPNLLDDFHSLYDLTKHYMLPI